MDNDWRSAFFIDTFSRTSSPDHPSARLKFWSKSALLVLAWALQQAILNTVSCKHSGCSSLRLRLTSAFSGIFVMRVLMQMNLFWRRGIPWIEVLAEAGGIIPVSFASLAWGAASNVRPVGWSELFSVPLFVTGTAANFIPEFQRYLWKKGKGREGRLYTGSLFAYCRHPNYTGEVLSFVGHAMATGRLVNQWIPACMGIGMAVLSCRELDFYLEKRYAAEWPSYAARVRWGMLPGIW
eukprot:TRINITY_DN66798_c0_g1_i1.p1 TRINITY_DN66798_c0_g1~~TRINITY_DN66798_c0_g1_i1.p1  ORF type:complete len:255 (-),score=12.18 TRINITY_DN66798_c0_g1_i1:69-782(-)